MRKSRNSLADSELSGSGSEDLPRFHAVEEELISSQGSSSRSAKFQGDTDGTSSEELESSEGSADSSVIPSESETNISLEQNDDELSEQSHKSTDVVVKNKKPIPKPRKHIPKKDSNSETPKNEVNVLGVNVRQTSTLKFKKFIRCPRIRISLFDQSTGQLAKKSNSSKNVVFNKEPESLDHILPIISTRGKMISEMSFSWNEIIILNDDVEHLMGTNFIMFFEIIDIVPNPAKHAKHKKVHDGWYHACWAFIRLSSQTKEKFGENLNLQLYKYKHLAENNPIFQQWLLPNLTKYPGTLAINFTSIVPKCEGLGLSRPFTALETDKTLPFPSSNNSSVKEVKEDLAPSGWIKTFDIIRRRSSFEPPTKKIFECATVGSSTVCRFSPNGRCVAYSDNSVKGPTIFVKFINNLNTSLILRGHTNIIHSLDWYSVDDESRRLLLISTSEDQSCIVWRVDENSFTLQHVLPHPCFLYCSIYIVPKGKQKPQIITGGRDCILRVWDISSSIPRILQEIDNHSVYIVGMALSNVLQTFLSADSEGKIIEWEYNGTRNWRMKREFNVQAAIKQLYLHPLATNAYVLLDRLLVKIDLQSGSLQWPLKNFIGTTNVERFSISESGANIFLVINLEIICVHQFSEEILCKIRLKRGSGRTNYIEFSTQGNLLGVSMRNSVFGGEFFLFGPEEKEDFKISTESRRNFQEYRNSDGPFLRNSTFNEILNKLENILKVKRDIPPERKILLKQSSKDEELCDAILKDEEGDRSDNLTYSVQRSGTFTIDKESKQKKSGDKNITFNKNTFTVSLNSETDDDDATDVSIDLQNSRRPQPTQRSNRTVILCKELENEDIK